MQQKQWSGTCNVESNFSPAVGVEVIYDKYMGIIRHVDKEYLTLCIRAKSDCMISDVCLVIHKEDWSSIDLPKRSERWTVTRDTSVVSYVSYTM